ncbi:hypothetical protein [Anaerophaga thermohalophila]|uniref:hypothetical protein n=1 Tax=Anaerophaga thermohalophila TaxID=177400 RepID=UPI0002E07B75|nr:hypothetical protein [Anaerophaga thermohalophila]
MNDFIYLKGAVACPLSGPADGGKPKWATFMALRNGRKFWLSRGARFKRTRPFWFFLGQYQKEQWKINLKQVADFFRNLYLSCVCSESVIYKACEVREYGVYSS